MTLLKMSQTTKLNNQSRRVQAVKNSKLSAAIALVLSATAATSLVGCKSKGQVSEAAAAGDIAPSTTWYSVTSAELIYNVLVDKKIEKNFEGGSIGNWRIEVVCTPSECYLNGYLGLDHQRHAAADGQSALPYAVFGNLVRQVGTGYSPYGYGGNMQIAVIDCTAAANADTGASGVGCMVAGGTLETVGNPPSAFPDVKPAPL